ncbi:MAG: hypothetical protein HYU03_00945 [Thaumarchaeota archaeon]|nr:hypothetical protein [Nitrososphaerota archaeon]
MGKSTTYDEFQLDQPPRRNVTARSVALALAVVVITQAIALAITRVNQPVLSQLGYSYAPAGTSSLGSAGNALILVAFVFATTLLALFLVRRNKVNLFRLLIFTGTLVAIFVLTLLAADNFLSPLFGERVSTTLSLTLAVVLAAILAASTFIARLASLRSVVTVLLSAEVGSYLASTIPFLTAILIPVVFSIYDIYAVFKGPLKHLISISPENIGPISTRVGEFTIGVGDTVFYSMLPSLVFFQFNLVCAIITALAVNAGVVFTLYALARSRMLPGLPIPMGMGLLALLLCVRPF